jgi:hypothetical protein
MQLHLNLLQAMKLAEDELKHWLAYTAFEASSLQPMTRLQLMQLAV